MKKSLLLLIFIFYGIHISAQFNEGSQSSTESLKNDPAYIKYYQRKYIEKISELKHEFNGHNIEVYSAKVFLDRNTKYFFFKIKYKKNVVKHNDKKYYNVLFEAEIQFKNVYSVSESENNILFSTESFLVRAKPENEYWSEFVKNNGSFSIVVKDREKRKEALEAFQYLVQYPHLDK